MMLANIPAGLLGNKVDRRSVQTAPPDRWSLFGLVADLAEEEGDERRNKRAGATDRRIVALVLIREERPYRDAQEREAENPLYPRAAQQTTKYVPTRPAAA
jgi:hypothetical protein